MRVQTLASNQQLSLKNVFKRPEDDGDFIQGQSLIQDVFIASELVGQTATKVMGVLGGAVLAGQAFPDASPILTAVGGGVAGYQLAKGFDALANAAGNLSTRASGSAGVGRLLRVGLKVATGAALLQQATPAGVAATVLTTVAIGGPIHAIMGLARRSKAEE